jgi:hypothetical protein
MTFGTTHHVASNTPDARAARTQPCVTPRSRLKALPCPSASRAPLTATSVTVP